MNEKEPDPNSTIALANALQSWPHLQSLNLAYNSIGDKNETSASYFLDKLSELATTVHDNRGTLEVNLLYGIQSISWTQAASTLQALTQQQIQNACQAQICTGKPLNATTAEAPAPRRAAVKKRDAVNKKEAPMMTSAASRPTPPFERMAKYVQSWFSWEAWNNSYDEMLNLAIAYAQNVVNDCSSYFPYKADNKKLASEGDNLSAYSYPSPHVRVIIDRDEFQYLRNFNASAGQEEEPLYLPGSNYTQAAIYHSFGSVLPTYQPLMLGR